MQHAWFGTDDPMVFEEQGYDKRTPTERYDQDQAQRDLQHPLPFGGLESDLLLLATGEDFLVVTEHCHGFGRWKLDAFTMSWTPRPTKGSDTR
jgi:hypothetical protein